MKFHNLCGLRTESYISLLRYVLAHLLGILLKCSTSPAPDHMHNCSPAQYLGIYPMGTRLEILDIIHVILCGDDRFILCADDHLSASFADLYALGHLLLNLRSPRDYVRPSSCRPFVRPSRRRSRNDCIATHSYTIVGSRLWYFLSPLDGASVRQQQASEAHWFMKLGSLLYVRCCHRSAKSTAVSNKTFLFQVTHVYLFCGSVTLST